MTEAEKHRFDAICAEEAYAEGARESIGTYGEKRLHRILKRFYANEAGETEASVGSYVADVLRDTEIVEIQTGSFYPLLPKLTYYLNETPYRVTVVHPILAEHRILRMDRETGELLRARRSSRTARPTDLLPELYWIRKLVPNDRLTIRLLSVSAEELRYSERMRHRREGAYDSEIFPRAAIEERVFTRLEDYRSLLPEVDSFSVAEYERLTRLTRRPADRALRFLCEKDLLTRTQEGRKYIYTKQ